MRRANLKSPFHAFTLFLLLISLGLIVSASYVNSLSLKISTFWVSEESPSVEKLAQKNSISEIMHLQQALAQTKLELFQLKEQLRTLTNFREKFSKKKIPLVIPATIIIRNDSSDNRHSFKIDRGSFDNIKLGDIVVFNDSLVGRVSEISDHYSTVLKVTDPAMQIPISVFSADDREKEYGEGISIGNGQEDSTCIIDSREICRGEELCRLDLVERKRQFPASAVIVTSGLKGEYPRGLVVGSLTFSQSDQIGLFWDVKIRPLNLDQIHTVLVFSYF